MTPDARGRHCAKCQAVVHDLSQYTPEQAEALLSDGAACVRAKLRPDGRVLTRPSRLGRVLTVAFAAPALLLTLSGCIMGKPASSAPTEAEADSSAPGSSAPADAR